MLQNNEVSFYLEHHRFKAIRGDGGAFLLRLSGYHWGDERGTFKATTRSATKQAR